MGIVTLTTDFGLRDWFVGTMKGVLLGIQPKAQIVDITHSIPPGDITAAAFALAAAVPSFPKGTVHLAVVDPGVGSDRRAIAVQTGRHFYVGPDNGVLSLALARDPHPWRIRHLQNPEFFLEKVSRTFQGRDIFAPVAAHLSKGAQLSRMGPALSDFVRCPWAVPVKTRAGWKGAIVYLDQFGNAITNLAEESSLFAQNVPLQVRVRGVKATIPVRPFYEAVPAGKPLALFASTGYLEIAINGGNASEKLHLRVGDSVTLTSAE